MSFSLSVSDKTLTLQKMESHLLFSLVILLPMAMLITVTSCSKDDKVEQPLSTNNANNASDTGDNSDQQVSKIVVTVDVDSTEQVGNFTTKKNAPRL